MPENMYNTTMKELYTIDGIVKKGAGKGREFGYPTANVSLQSNIPAGVYVSQVTVDDKVFKAATFIGSAVTFGDAEYKSESTLLDFDKDIYGKEIRIQLLKKLRDNANFENEEMLIEQMEKDMLAARSFFNDIS